MAASNELSASLLREDTKSTTKGHREPSLGMALSGWMVAAVLACALVIQHLRDGGSATSAPSGSGATQQEIALTAMDDKKIDCRWLLLTLIRAAGIGQLALVVSSLAIPFLLDYRKELGEIKKPLLRQMFLVYSGYILMINLFFGLISTFAAETILEVGFLPSVIAGFIFLYWFARLMIAIFVFDLSFLDRPHEIVGRVGIELLFTLLPVIYGIALVHDLGKLSLQYAVPDIGPFGRMLVIIIVLFMVMKICVFMMPKSKGSELTYFQMMLFFFVWPGMQPARFLERKKGLDWWKDAMWGTLWTILGILWCFGIKFISDAGLSPEWAGLLALPAVSMMGHIGAFRLLRGALRLVGYDVEQLFVDPLLATSLSDFWGQRWNIAFSDMNRFVFVAAIKAALTEDLQLSKDAASLAGVFTAFVASAGLHEFGITLPVLSGFGGPSLYFVIQGFCVVVEKQTTTWRENHPICTRLIMWIALATPFPLLFVVAFRTEIVLPLTLFIANLPTNLLEGRLLSALCESFGTKDICTVSP
mmetsp:Transcript_167939/g.322480  ORF Transcript_167939/g.322480 Transcript_167939/m.322480 type:complete len:531 (+) Transcript_167939:62-1654(+)